MEVHPDVAAGERDKHDCWCCSVTAHLSPTEVLYDEQHKTGTAGFVWEHCVKFIEQPLQKHTPRPVTQQRSDCSVNYSCPLQFIIRMLLWVQRLIPGWTLLPLCLFLFHLFPFFCFCFPAITTTDVYLAIPPPHLQAGHRFFWVRRWESRRSKRGGPREHDGAWSWEDSSLTLSVLFSTWSWKTNQPNIFLSEN